MASPIDETTLLDAEEMILGSLIHRPEIIEKNPNYMNLEYYSKKTHRNLLKMIAGLLRENKPVNMISLMVQNDNLKGSQDYIDNFINLVARLSGMTDILPNTEYYIQLLRENYLHRRLNFTIDDSLKFKNKTDLLQSISEIEQNLGAIRNEALNTHSPQYHIKTLCDIYERQYNEQKNVAGLSGHPTGFGSIDKYTGGLQPGEFIVIGARPSVGKTALILSMIKRMQINRDLTPKADAPPTLFFSIEMSNKLIIDRLLANIAGLNLSVIRNPFTANEQGYTPKILSTLDIIRKTNLLVVEKSNIGITEIEEISRASVRNGKANIIFIDYLTLIKTKNDGTPRWEQFTEISQRLKALARGLNVPVICLSQTTREVHNVVPTMAALRESGSIEQDADVIGLLYPTSLESLKAERQYAQEKNDNVEITLKIDKNRNGPTGKVRLGFNKITASYYEAAS